MVLPGAWSSATSDVYSKAGPEQQADLAPYIEQIGCRRLEQRGDMDRRDIVSSLKPVDTTSLFEGLDYSSQPVPIAQLLNRRRFSCQRVGLGVRRFGCVGTGGAASGACACNVLPVFQPPEAEPGRKASLTSLFWGLCLTCWIRLVRRLFLRFKRLATSLATAMRRCRSGGRRPVTTSALRKCCGTGTLIFQARWTLWSVWVLILLDPLTYAFGAGVALRSLRSGEQLIDTALDAARVAEAAGDAGKAARLRNVLKRSVRTLLVACWWLLGEPQLLRELGVDVGLRFSRPGTGRLGRAIIDRPLGAISQTYRARCCTSDKLASAVCG